MLSSFSSLSSGIELSMILPIALALVVLYWLVWRRRRRRLYQLADLIRGGKELPFIGHAHKFFGNAEHIMKALSDISYDAMKFDGITKVWMGPILLFFMVDPEDIEYVLRTCLEKDDLHRFIRDLAGNGVVFAPVEIWRQRKKHLIPVFAPAVVESYLQIFAEQCRILVGKLRKPAGKGTFDLWPYLSSCTLDSVCETAMGVKLKAQSDSNTPFLVAMYQLLKTMTERIFHVWLHPELIFRLTPQAKKYEASKRLLYSVIDDFILQKKLQANSINKSVDSENRPKIKTYLEHLISLSNIEKSYSDIEIREEALSLTIAGTDTTAGAMAFTLMLLGEHQDVQDKVYEELINVFGTSERDIVKEDLSKLCCLERVVKESLRLHPPAPFIARKIEEEIKLPSGRVLPAGCGVGISLWGILRHPKYWGLTAEDFDPDRFLPSRFDLLQPGVYIPFSSGPRNCVGQQYAKMSILTGLSTVLRRYRVVESGVNGASKRIRVKMDITLKAAAGFRVALERRPGCVNGD